MATIPNDPLNINSESLGVNRLDTFYKQDEQAKKKLVPQTSRQHQVIDLSQIDNVASLENLTDTQRHVMGALIAQESGGNRNSPTSIDGARGIGQIIPSTFKMYAKQGESIDNPDHNLAVMARIVKDLGTRSGDSPEKMAVGYFSGAGNINKGTGNAWLNDAADGNGKKVSSYVADVVGRMSGTQAKPSEAKLEVKKPLMADSAPKWGTVVAKPEYLNMSIEDRKGAREAYFDQFIAPDIAPGELAQYKEWFNNEASKVEPKNLSILDKAKQTVSRLFSGGEPNKKQEVPEQLLNMRTGMYYPNPAFEKLPLMERYRPNSEQLAQQQTNDVATRLSYGAGPISQATVQKADDLRNQVNNLGNDQDPTAQRVAASMNKQGVKGFQEKLNDTSAHINKAEFNRNAQAEKTRDASEWSRDLISSVGQGSVGLLQLPTNIISPSGALADTLRSAQKELQSMESDTLKAQREILRDRVHNEEGFFGKYIATVEELVTNPALSISEAAKQLPNFAAILGAAKLVGAASGGVVTVASNNSPSIALAEAISGGALKQSATQIGSAVGGIGASMSMAGGDAAGQVYDKLTNAELTPLKLWEKNPDYQKLVSQGVPSQDAIKEIATSKARMAAMYAAPLGVLGFMGAESSIISRGFGAAQPFTGKTAAKVIGKELAGEQIEEGGTALTGNAVSRTVDPKHKLSEGVAEAMATATVTSLPMSGLAVGSHYQSSKQNERAIAQKQSQSEEVARSIISEENTQKSDLVEATPNANSVVKAAPNANDNQSNKNEKNDFDIQGYAETRESELLAKRDGEIDYVTDPVTGEMSNTQKAGKGLSKAEQTELKALEQANGDVAKLNALYGQDLNEEVQQEITPIENVKQEASPVQEPIVEVENNGESIKDKLLSMANVEKNVSKPTESNKAFQRGMFDAMEGTFNQSRKSTAYKKGHEFAIEKLKEINTPENKLNESKTIEAEQATTQGSEQEQTVEDQITIAANEAATSETNDTPMPTDAQKEAGNYKKGHISVHGFNISIENPKGSTRSGTDKDGKAWENTMQQHYGYIKGTVGMDKDHIDTFIGENHESNKVFVVDQVDPLTGKPDEHKVMMGFNSQEEAQAAYQANYAKDWTGGKTITETTVEAFKEWIASGNTKKPFAKPKTEKEAKARRANKEEIDHLFGTLQKKQIPDMTDDELIRAKDLYSPEHKRHAKIVKAIEKRGLGTIDRVTELAKEKGKKNTVRDVIADEIAQANADIAQLKQEAQQSGISTINDDKIAKEEKLLGVLQKELEKYEVAKNNNNPTKDTESTRKGYLGRNEENKVIIEDDNGVRSYIDRGIRVAEPVSLTPTSNGIRTSIDNRRDEFRTVEELAKRASANEVKRDKQDAEPKAEDQDLDAMFDDVLAEELEKTESDKSDTRDFRPTITAISDAIDADLRKKKARLKRLQNEAKADVVTLEERLSRQTKVKAAEATLRKMRQSSFDAEDAAYEVIKTGDTSKFSEYADLFDNTNALLNEGINKTPAKPKTEREAKEAKTQVTVYPMPKKPKTEREAKERKTKDAAVSAVKNTADGFINAIDGLGALFGGKGTLGSGPVFNEETYAKAKPLFQAAVANFDQAGTDIKEVMRAVVRLVLEKFGGSVVNNMKPYIVKFVSDYNEEGQKENSNDTATQSNANQVNLTLLEGQPAISESVTRGAKPTRSKQGRSNDRGVRGSRKQSNAVNDGQQDLGYGDGLATVSDAKTGNVERSGERLHADFIPSIGGLTRQGSWFDTAKRNIDLIELAIKIESENRQATPEEQENLSKYVGFGAGAIRNTLFPIPHSYAKKNEPNRLIWPNLVTEQRWKELAIRMDALPKEWQKSVLQSSQYAHYTSENIIRSTWSAVQRLGFTGGKVFEPGMGIGSFSMLMPENVRNTSTYTGVEFDGPTALIAKLLQPEQNMLHDDFIKRKFPQDFFDVAIGNPPFSQTKVFGDPQYEKFGFMLHDFFFAKTIDRVRPGGLLAFVTSKGTMDKQNDKARKYLSERADLLGAIRLPSTAFEGNAGTSVVTDVLFLRKRKEGESVSGKAWKEIKAVETQDGTITINEYFADNPHMVLGQNRISGNQDDLGRRINSNGYGGESYTVVSYDTKPEELDAKFAAAVEMLPENVYSVMSQTAKEIKAETAKIDFDPSIKREGVVYLNDNGTLMRVENGVGRKLSEDVKLTESDVAWFKSYVDLRGLVQVAREAQFKDGKWEDALKKLNKAYDQFRNEHGPINDFRVQVRKSTDEDGNTIERESRIFKNRRRLREDYDSSILTSLEAINEAGEIVKSNFLLGRTIGKPVERDVKSIGDSLAVSLDTLGTLDLDDIANRIGITKQEAIEALDSQIYRTPDGEWQLADEYLSGDVVAKLEEAEQASRIDSSLKRNVDALKEVQPEKLGPSKISAKLGASWIPVSHVNEFASEIGAGFVTFDNKTESWQVEGGNLRSGRNAGAEYGTAARSSSELLEAALNSRSVKIMTKTADNKQVADQEATTAANEMLKKIKDKFKGWVWTDTERATDLVESYNNRFNNIAPRLFDGSHLTLPGVSMRFNLHPHQRRAIWRMVQTGNTYLAHAVGSGKTIEMIAGGMEQKRLGLIKKPMYVVPNHMLEQFSNEFMELYPLANIMVADDENFSAERRRAFIANATLNNPDAIIITHDAFQRIGIKEESVAPIRDEIITDLEIELSSIAKDSGERVRRSQLEQQIEAVTQRFDRIVSAGGKDSTLKFEDIGVDFIFADEAHAYRKLDFHTSQQIKGIDPNGSKRSLDMYVKTRYLDKLKPGRSMVFASGTPVTNTMGELYTIMRFFAQESLDQAGISTFDAWSRQFGEVSPALEPNAAGKYELIERFAKFDNVPELMSRVRQFMDVLTSENLGALVKRPDLKGGKPNLNIVKPSSSLEEYMQGELANRIEASKKWKPSKDQPNNPDPIVAIITDGRFAAIDPRFFGGELNENGSIITEMADKVSTSYHDGKDAVFFDKNGKPEANKGSTQVVFYNLGFGEQSQKSRGFNSRAAFTKAMVDKGVKREHIAWFDDANTDAKKETVFKDMRSGKLRILIGSAKKMGTGVNVQKRLAVLHYQDPPWFPADVEQPHGRIIRQGNQNTEVAIEWYTTKGTYQSTMWQMVGRKQRFIDQAFTGDKNLRSMDDMGEASLFEQAAAVASGDPRAIQLAGLNQDVERYERLQAAHASEQIKIRSAISSAEWGVKSANNRIKTYGDAFRVIGSKYFSLVSGSVNNRNFEKPGEFGQAIKEAFNKVVADNQFVNSTEKVIGKLSDNVTVSVDQEIQFDKPTGEFNLFVNVGEMSLEVTRGASMGESVDAAGLTRRIINQVNSIEVDLRKAKELLTENEIDLVKLKKKYGAPFEYQQEMAEKYGELKALEAELQAEGEIKNTHADIKIDDNIALSKANLPDVRPFDTKLEAELFKDENNIPGKAIETVDGWLREPRMQLTERESKESKVAVSGLNQALKEHGMPTTRHLSKAPSKMHALARAIGGVFDVKVHFVDNTGDFDGVAHKGNAFLAEGIRRPELAIVGHEVTHAIEQSNPSLGKKLRKVMRSYLKRGVVAKRRRVESPSDGDLVTRHYAEGEVLADIGGAMWMDSQFWGDMYKADKNLFRQVAYKFMEVATKAIKILSGSRFDVANLVKDVNAVRAIYVAVFTEHNQTKDLKNFETQGAVAMSQVGNGRSTPEEILAMEAEEIIIESHTAPIATGEEIERAASLFLSTFPEGTTRHISNSPTVRKAKRYSEEALHDIGGDPEQERSVASKMGPFSEYQTHARIEQNFYGKDQLVIEVFGKEQIDSSLDAEPALKIELQLDGDFSIYAPPSSSETYKEFVKRGWAEPATGKNKEVQYFAGEDGEYWTRLTGFKPSEIIPLLGDIHARALAWTGKPYMGLSWQRTTGASGGTDGHRAAVLFSRSSEHASITDKTQKELIDEFGKPNFSTIDWWDKSVGTMYNTTKKNPVYAKVFHLFLDRENAVSRTSVRPASLAPAFLPRVDDFKSAWATMRGGKKQNKQLALASSVLIDGTLQGDTVMQGKVFSDQELIVKGLNANGIALYKQAREAIDASIDEVAAAEAYGAVQMFVPKSLKDAVLDYPRDANRILTNAIDRRIDFDNRRLKQLKKGRAEKEAIEAIEQSITSSTEAKETMGSIFEQAGFLKDAGYVPLMRFGKYSVTVEEVDPNTGKIVLSDEGEANVVFFRRYETEGEAQEAYFRQSALHQNDPSMRVISAPVNDMKHMMYDGISPETIALFANLFGDAAVENKIYQQAVSERSALKRQLGRKSISGFSEDLPRVLANFITSNGRHAAARYYSRDINNAIRYMPREHAETQKFAQEQKAYLDNPQDAGAMASGLAFTWFLGGNIASAAINATQPVMMTLPYLSQWGVKAATKEIASATPYAMGKKQIIDPQLRHDLKRASQEGRVDAQEIFHLYTVGIQGVAAALNGKMSKLPLIGKHVKGASESGRARMNAALTLWGMPFAMVEGFNRRLTFIAAWNLAKSQSMNDPFAFASQAVDETQGIYNKVNRSKWGTSSTGRVILTFAQFRIMNVELLKRMALKGGAAGKKGAAVYLAVLILASGVGGLPFGDDLDDLIDTVGQFIGYDTNMKRNKREWAFKTMGEFYGELALYGMSSQLPMDFGSRMGLGNMIPGTGIAKISNADRTPEELSEVGGAVIGGLGRQFSEAFKDAAEGNYVKAIAGASPTAIKNLVAGLDMIKTGKARDTKGREKVEVNVGEGALKSIGFNPTKVSDLNRANMPIYQDLALQRSTEANIVERWAKGIVADDKEEQKIAENMLLNWNRKNPKTPISISVRQIKAKVRALSVPVEERLLKSAPKEMRESVTAGLDMES